MDQCLKIIYSVLNKNYTLLHYTFLRFNFVYFFYDSQHNYFLCVTYWHFIFLPLKITKGTVTFIINVLSLIQGHNISYRPAKGTFITVYVGTKPNLKTAIESKIVLFIAYNLIKIQRTKVNAFLFFLFYFFKLTYLLVY